MSGYSQLTVAQLLSAIASGEPAPGGGSASALTGAIGASLLMMVASLPRTRHGTAEERAMLDAAAARVRPLRDELTTLIDRDSDAYRSVIDALGLPKSSDAERELRRAALGAAMRDATDAPLATMRACYEVMREAAAIAEHGPPSAASDAAVAIELLTAAARGAAVNVDTNIAGIKDADYAGRVARERIDLELAIGKLLPAGR